MFSVNVLFYGDHAALARRCLAPLMANIDKGLVAEIRIGLNLVCAETAAAVRAFAGAVPVVCHVYEPKDRGNRLKYPMMRKMLYDEDRPVAGTRVMWFDDDSFIHPKIGRGWWADVDKEWKESGAKVMGSVYTPGYRWNAAEQLAIKGQAWYNGADIAEKPRFATGGWWVADLGFLRRWGYPIYQLKHNGGDVLLGEICRQQKAKLVHYKHGVAINADEWGKESKAIRRGDSSRRPFEIAGLTDISHHDFEVNVETYP